MIVIIVKINIIQFPPYLSVGFIECGMVCAAVTTVINTESVEKRIIVEKHKETEWNEGIEEYEH